MKFIEKEINGLYLTDVCKCWVPAPEQRLIPCSKEEKEIYGAEFKKGADLNDYPYRIVECKLLDTDNEMIYKIVYDPFDGRADFKTFDKIHKVEVEFKSEDDIQNGVENRFVEPSRHFKTLEAAQNYLKEFYLSRTSRISNFFI